MAVSIYRGINTPENCIFHILGNAKTEIKQDDEKAAKYAQINQQIAEKAKTIAENIGKVDDASSKTAEKKNTVTELLKNIIAFCNKNTSMDEASVKQMAAILETTMNSLQSFDENISEANDGAKAVKASIGEISELVESLKAE
jgi:predicted Ser/Thr protein kinase